MIPGTIRTLSIPSKTKRRPDDIEELDGHEQHPQGHRRLDPLRCEAHSIVPDEHRSPSYYRRDQELGAAVVERPRSLIPRSRNSTMASPPTPRCSRAASLAISCARTATSSGASDSWAAARGRPFGDHRAEAVDSHHRSTAASRLAVGRRFRYLVRRSRTTAGTLRGLEIAVHPVMRSSPADRRAPRNPTISGAGREACGPRGHHLPGCRLEPSKAPMPVSVTTRVYPPGQGRRPALRRLLSVERTTSAR